MFGQPEGRNKVYRDCEVMPSGPSYSLPVTVDYGNFNAWHTHHAIVAIALHIVPGRPSQLADSSPAHRHMVGVYSAHYPIAAFRA